MTIAVMAILWFVGVVCEAIVLTDICMTHPERGMRRLDFNAVFAVTMSSLCWPCHRADEVATAVASIARHVRDRRRTNGGVK